MVRLSGQHVRATNYESLRVELRFKNALLWRSIFSTYESVADFCRVNNLLQDRVGSLLNLKSSPYHKRTGKPTAMATRLCEILNYSTGELFPIALYSGVVPTGILATEIMPDRLLSLNSPDVLALTDYGEFENALIENIDRDQLIAEIREATNRLPARQQKTVEMRFFENATLEMVGDVLNVTRERARQIEIDALRRVRSMVSEDRTSRAILASWAVPTPDASKLKKPRARGLRRA